MVSLPSVSGKSLSFSVAAKIDDGTSVDVVGACEYRASTIIFKMGDERIGNT